MPLPHPRQNQTLAAIASVLGPLYLGTTLLTGIIWVTGLGPGMIADPEFAKRVTNPDLRAALALLASSIDSIWITLGAIQVYLSTAVSEGLSRTRTWSATVFGCSIVLGALSVTTTLPLGPVFFPTNLGWKILAVPFAWPFLWILILFGVRDFVLRAFSRASHIQVTIITGLAVGVTDLLIEPIAWKYRAWWLWYPAQLDAPSNFPWTAPLTWSLAAALFAYLMRPPLLDRQTANPSWSPRMIYAGFLTVFAVARLTR